VFIILREIQGRHPQGSAFRDWFGTLLNSVMFDLSTLPRKCGQSILVTDKVQAPAEFILHQIISSHLRDAGTRVIIGSCLVGLSHWKTTTAKMSPGFNLTSRIAAGSVVFLDQLDRISHSEQPDGCAPSMKILYDEVCEAMQHESDSPTDCNGLFVLDGLSSYEWMGVPLSHLKRFIRAIFALCSKRRYALLIRHNKLGDDRTDELLRLYLQLSAIHLEALPLSTGRSGAITGEINVLKGSSLVESDIWEALRRQNTIQYRLLDSGPLFFERGTSASVL